ncbi:MAG: phage Gp37/Gp68 family protein [Deltaproteobacteria bacterium]|jgi:protein gp37|nr:phage Gp37/Gp68 family protein [Deltaproteobacteria bacterium]
MSYTKIEWSDKTWNPVTGCAKISSGCVNCYAQKMAYRLQAMGSQKYSNGFNLTLHPDTLQEPLKWTKSSTIFICSMSDLFHEDVPFKFIDEIMETINKTKQHRYQILTKRPDRMFKYFNTRVAPFNVWLGVTVEDIEATPRIDILRELRSSIRFISCEPLIGDLGTLDLTNIDWVIVGGETGTRARFTRPEWVLSLLEQTKDQNIPFFFKQWGMWGSDGIKRSKKANGKTIDGQIYQMTPEIRI